MTNVTGQTAKAVFTKVASIGLNGGYFTNTFGTVNSTARTYMYGCFGWSLLETVIYGQYSLNYTYISGSLLNYGLVYAMLPSSSPYGARYLDLNGVSSAKY